MVPFLFLSSFTQAWHSGKIYTGLQKDSYSCQKFFLKGPPQSPAQPLPAQRGSLRKGSAWGTVVRTLVLESGVPALVPDRLSYWCQSFLSHFLSLALRFSTRQIKITPVSCCCCPLRVQGETLPCPPGPAPPPPIQAPMAHGPSECVRDLLLPQICLACSLSCWGLHFSLPRMFQFLLLVTPNLVQIKCHFLLEA